MSQIPAELMSEHAVAELALPAGLIDEQLAYPTVFVDTGDASLLHLDRGAERRVNDALYDALRVVHSGATLGQTLIKAHIGEPRCGTRMQPAFVEGTVRFLRERGAASVVAGDTTVAYSGPRGHHENPTGDSSAYLALAARHGWCEDGPAGVPFVVLDRPSTATPRFSFADEESRREVPGVQRFGHVCAAGGFEAADFVVNHAHLTLHGLAGVAGCVKSLAMGCSSLTGKLRMHRHLFPYFSEGECSQCGQCVESCPEAALSLPSGAACPVVDEEKCIGCGECVSVCAASSGAVSLRGRAIRDWSRGEATLAERMADHVVGLMDGRWDDTIHVLHLCAVTPLCDCVDRAQEPMLSHDIGFLVGKNPFVIDLLAARMLVERLWEEHRDADESLLVSAAVGAHHARENYGILTRTRLERMPV